jgi:hypothetical protein
MTGKMVIKRLGEGGHSVDLPMAGLAALSVAFIAYAMPNALFTDVIQASGLPSLLPAAQPPLGTTARIAVVAAGAIATFVFTWLVLRALGAPSPARRRESLEVEMPPLRLRRADSHPDAPTRRPIIAGLELGEPVLVEEDPAVQEQPEPAEAVSEIEQPDDTIEDESESDIVAQPSPLELEKPSIAELMQRLEAGLVRRHRQVASPAPQPESSDFMEIEPARDDRLLGALDELRRMAARGA